MSEPSAGTGDDVRDRVGGSDGTDGRSMSLNADSIRGCPRSSLAHAGMTIEEIRGHYRSSALIEGPSTPRSLELQRRTWKGVLENSTSLLVSVGSECGQGVYVTWKIPSANLVGPMDHP